MDLVEKAVARLTGAVFAVDERLRVVAWNRKAEEGFGLAAAQAIGRPCYEVVPAVDMETGRPCHEQCPLAQSSPLHGWAYNRVLKAPWAGGRRARLDCFLLKCLLPTAQRATLCFVGPPKASQIAAHSRVLEAIEAIYPAVSGLADLRETLAVALRAVLRMTSADDGEIFLLDPETRELVLMERQGRSATGAQGIRQSAIGEAFADLLAHSEVPLLAVGASPEELVGGASGWYLCAPLVAEDRVMGALGIASQRPDFDVATAVRILFPVAVQLGVYLRWAYDAEEVGPKRVKEQLPREAARLRFHCLGPLHLFLDGEPVPTSRFRRSKALTVLKFLAAHRGRPVTREALMELLWPEADPARAGAHLRVVLHALRHGLAPASGGGQVPSFILSQGDLVYLAPSELIWVDSEEFSQRAHRAAELARQGRREEALAECRRAASLYRGEYLEDEPYTDWCLFERERLKEMYLTLLTRMASLLARGGDVAGAVETYRRALDVDRGREETHRELIRLLWQVGLRGEALHQYETCRRILQEELGIEPTEETEALYQELLMGASPRGAG